ncbi:MAG: sulfotransferase family protein [Actinomycetia bacterium]|nr:sulfotransferase family protein [Actinomycetes bacterium]
MSTTIYPDLRICFWSVLKCGSTTMSRLFGTSPHWMSGNHTQQDYGDDWTHFAVVRDPVDRWVSGLNTVRKIEGEKRSKGFDFAKYLDAKLAEMRERGKLWTGDYNSHLQPQYLSLPTDRHVTLFPLERIATIPAWLESLGVELAGKLPHERRTHPLQHQMAREALTDADRQMILAYYHQDVDLYRRAVASEVLI